MLTIMGSASLPVQGTNKGNATVASCNVATNGLNFATVDGDVATFVADDALALNGSYKVMTTGATATFAFAEAGTIAFDTALFTPTYAITAAEGLDLTDATVGTVTTYTAAAQSSGEDWVDDSSTIQADTTAGTQYPSLAGTDLADADAKELTDWAKANNVVFADAVSGATGYVDAFLLNCAPVAATVADETAAFKLNITMGADGTPTVTTPDGKTYNGTLQLKGSNDLDSWTDVSAASTDYKFYKAVLSL